MNEYKFNWEMNDLIINQMASIDISCGISFSKNSS